MYSMFVFEAPEAVVSPSSKLVESYTKLFKRPVHLAEWLVSKLSANSVLWVSDKNGFSLKDECCKKL